ncbi:MAG: LPP20 family lipoprotein [Selenomonadaceae bacterium]|nr:LPP20 family lipoprotein [Selenomonadaceae bacterium]MBQ6130834.1 LPP20 family lipoprotein [Selenomonadaceae bacterium]MBQ7493276.1 LPP20 family lipoprotein [Selenomonadaceae bacterium]
MKKLFTCLTVLLATMFLLTGVRAEAAVDWGDKVITVRGMGTANPQMVKTPAHALMMARRAAIADGYRQMAELITGVQVDAETTVEQMMLTSDIVKTRVSAIIKGAVIVSEGELAGGGYEVEMQVPLFGATGLSTAVIPPAPVIEPFPQPAPEVIPSMPADSQTGDSVGYNIAKGGERSPMAAIGGYTGLIIDCRGLNLNPVMSPVIKNVKGVKLYGHENLNYDLVVRDGMVNYATDRNMADRAGAKPLVIKAERLEDHNANPVVSEADGSRILIENGASGFLNKTAVVFLY